MGGRPSAPVLASRRPTSAQLPRAKGSVEGVDAAFATFHVIAVIDPWGSDMPGGGSPLRPPWGAVGPRAEMPASPTSVTRGVAMSGGPDLTPQTPLGRRTAPSRGSPDTRQAVAATM